MTMFLQTITHKRTGITFDLSHLTDFVFKETLDLSGPLITVEIEDEQQEIRSDMELQDGDTLVVELADTSVRDGIEGNYEFTVSSHMVGERKVSLSAVRREVAALKEPAKATRLFHDKNLSMILRELFPGMVIAAKGLPLVADYHVLSGEKPVLALRQIEKENGLLIWVERRQVRAEKVTEILTFPPEEEYVFGDNKAPYALLSYHKIQGQKIIGERLKKHHWGFSLTAGRLDGAGDYPVSFYPVPVRSALLNASRFMRPLVAAVAHGCGWLRPGLVLKLVWHTMRQDAPIDETLPEKAVVMEVYHRYRAQKYICHFILGVPDVQ